MEKDKMTDQQYFANAETARNSANDGAGCATNVDNDDVKRYNEHFANKNDNVNTAKSDVIYKSSCATYQTQNQYVDDATNSDQDYAVKGTDSHRIDDLKVFEPYTDVESHVNYNTAPQYAGDAFYSKKFDCDNYLKANAEKNYDTTDSFDDCGCNDVRDELEKIDCGCGCKNFAEDCGNDCDCNDVDDCDCGNDCDCGGGKCGCDRYQSDCDCNGRYDER